MMYLHTHWRRCKPAERLCIAMQFSYRCERNADSESVIERSHLSNPRWSYQVLENRMRQEPGGGAVRSPRLLPHVSLKFVPVVRLPLFLHGARRAVNLPFRSGPHAP